MAEYFAQFDGDEVDGKVYGLGDTIADTVDAGTLAFLIGTGRIGTNKPAGVNSTPFEASGIPDDSDPRSAQLRVLDDVDPADMTRDELVRHIAALGTANATDDDLRASILERRQRAADDAGRTDGADGLKASLAGTVGDVAKRVGDMTDREQLEQLAELEKAGDKRTGVAKAIEDRLKALSAA